MTQETPVPLLDLAPKLKRPLSLWNPSDYLRLLYWVFYFPQALRWYVDTFGGGYIAEAETNKSKQLELLSPNSIHNNLLFQGSVLIFITPLFSNVILWGTDISNYLDFIVFGVLFYVSFGLILVAFDEILGEIFLAFSVAFSVTFNLASSMGLHFSVVYGMAFGLVFSMAGEMGFAIALGTLLGTAITLPWGITFGITLSVVALRIESWLIALFFNIQYLQKGSLLFLHITLLPIPLLSVCLKKWLQQDWEAGIYNANQLLAYTLQSVGVIKAINQVLNKTPLEQIIYRVAQLEKEFFFCNFMYFLSADLNKTLYSEAIRNIPFLSASLKQRVQNFFSTKTHLNTFVRKTADGFWYLHKKEPVKAKEAFTVVRSILYGKEMYTLAQNLAVFYHAKDFDDIVNIKLASPSYQGGDTEGVLRPTTWKTISSLHRVVEDAQLVKRSVSPTTRSFTLNHALGELTNILNNPQTLPQAERRLILDIAETWQQALVQIAGEVGEITITKPVRNPYIIGDPVIGEKFFGREEVMRQLEELWVMGEQLQSVVIYGHRRMGKTSILRNAAKSIGSGVKVAYVNMLNAGNISEGVGEVLMAISDAVSEVLNVPSPDDEKLLKLPEITFKRYLKQVVDKLQENSLQSLIIAIDEFEIIEELITAGKIPKNFLGYLRGLLQMNSKIAFAFAGLHTLEEMTADYFQPFFASVIPIHVGFMEPAVTRQILANPSLVNPNINKDDLENTEDFLLDYKPEALDKIYQLTHGQPYLVQLIGFVLVRRYNDQVFELGRKRDPIFTVEDVEAVIDNNDFFKRGRYYFDGIWSQAKQGTKGQQAILEVLAPIPQGLSYEDAIAEVFKKGFDEESLKKALDTLQRHDVVEESQGKWRIIVELFRRWLVKGK